MAQDEEVARAVGSYLRRLRVRAGMSLSRVVRLLREEGIDLSCATLSRVELGRAIPRMDTALALVERLGGTVDELAEVVRIARAESFTSAGNPASRGIPAAAGAPRVRLPGTGTPGGDLPADDPGAARKLHSPPDPTPARALPCHPPGTGTPGGDLPADDPAAAGALPPPRDPGAAREEARRLIENGCFLEARHRLEALVARLTTGPPPDVDPGILPRVRVDLAEAYLRLGMQARALRLLGEALGSRGTRPEDRFRAAVLHLGACSREEDRFLGGLVARWVREHLPEWSGTPLHPPAQAALAEFAHRGGRYREAAEDYLAAAASYRGQGREADAVQVEVFLADCLHHLGERLRALTLLRRAIELARKRGWKRVEARAHPVLAEAWRREGRTREARAEFSCAARIARELGQRTDLFLAIHGLWKVARDEGALGRARQEASVLRSMLPAVDPRLPQAREFREWQRRRFPARRRWGAADHPSPDPRPGAPRPF